MLFSRNLRTFNLLSCEILYRIRTLGGPIHAVQLKKTARMAVRGGDDPKKTWDIVDFEWVRMYANVCLIVGRLVRSSRCGCLGLSQQWWARVIRAAALARIVITSSKITSETVL